MQTCAKFCKKLSRSIYPIYLLSRSAATQSGQHATNFVSSACQKGHEGEGASLVRALQNSSKTFLNNLAQELKIANAAQHAKLPTGRGGRGGGGGGQRENE